MKTALIVDDWPELREVLAHNIEIMLPGWRAVQVGDMAGAETAYRSSTIHLAILDIALPESRSGGLELFYRWRADGATFPMILMSGAHQDKLWDAKEAGADDVVPKPFQPREFVSRIKSVLRRHEEATKATAAAPRVDGIRLTEDFTFAGVTVTHDLEIVFSAKKRVTIGPKEYGILRCFANRRGGLITKEEVIREVWGPDVRTDTNSIYNYITRLRRLFEDNKVSFDDAVQAESKAGWRITE